MIHIERDYYTIGHYARWERDTLKRIAMGEYRTSAIHEAWKDREAAEAAKPKSILDPAFKYTPSHATNIRERFDRMRREQEERRK